MSQNFVHISSISGQAMACRIFFQSETIAWINIDLLLTLTNSKKLELESKVSNFH